MVFDWKSNSLMEERKERLSGRGNILCLGSEGKEQIQPPVDTRGEIAG